MDTLRLHEWATCPAVSNYFKKNVLFLNTVLHRGDLSEDSEFSAHEVASVKLSFIFIIWSVTFFNVQLIIIIVKNKINMTKIKNQRQICKLIKAMNNCELQTLGDE